MGSRLLMELHVAISAERFDERLPGRVLGVGLIRGEYILRRARRYIRDPRACEQLTEYLYFVLEQFPDAPVWYRFSDAPSSEINLLEGTDAYLVEEFPEIGVRGMRRALQFPATFRREFESVAVVARQAANLNVILPYVTEMGEVVFALDMASQIGFRNQIGVMIETPAAVFHASGFRSLGIRHFVVGMNDLSSLVIGAGRGSGFDRPTHPALLGTLAALRETLADVSLAIAGYQVVDMVDQVEKMGFDQVVVHYCSLPRLLGCELNDFREIEFMKSFKCDDYRARLLRWVQDLYDQVDRSRGSELQSQLRSGVRRE